MSRKRLLSLGHSYAVGVNRMLPEEMTRVGEGDWEVTVAAPRYFHGTRDLRPLRLVQEPGERCRLVGVGAHLTNRVHVFFYGRDLKRLLAEPWDVIHSWEEPYIVAGAQIARWAPRSAALVYRSAQSLPKRYPPPFGAIERYSMSKANGWICSGRLVEENLAARAGYSGLPRARIPLGVDVSRFRPHRERGVQTLRELGWDPGPPVVGYLGRLVVEKGLPLLMESLDAQNEPWRALIIGAGPLESTLRDWAARAPERVRVLTNVVHNEVPRYLNAMDVLCAPSQTTSSWKEQFGRMIVEGFASGLAVLGSDSGEIPYVIGDAGLVVGERDGSGWREAIAELLGDSARRAELGRRGLDIAHQRYSWSHVASEYLSFFERVLSLGEST